MKVRKKYRHVDWRTREGRAYRSILLLEELARGQRQWHEHFLRTIERIREYLKHA